MFSKHESGMTQQTYTGRARVLVAAVFLSQRLLAVTIDGRYPKRCDAEFFRQRKTGFVSFTTSRRERTRYPSRAPNIRASWVRCISRIPGCFRCHSKPDATPNAGYRSNSWALAEGTTNSRESFHSCFSSMFCVVHTDIYQFLEVLKQKKNKKQSNLYFWYWNEKFKNC